MPSGNTVGCVRDATGNLLYVATADYLIPGHKVSYIEKVYTANTTIPKGIRVFLEPPLPCDLGGLTGRAVEVVYIWIGWDTGGDKVWDSW